MAIFTKNPTFIMHRANEKLFSPDEAASNPSSGSSLIDWVEIDVRRTGDGKLVVFHDEEIQNGQKVGSLPYSELQILGIQSLDEWIAALPAEINVVLDVKNSIDDVTLPPALRTGRLAVESAAKIALERSVLLTSFDPSIVYQAQLASRSFAFGLTTWQGVPLRESIPTAVEFQVEILIVHIDSLRPYAIKLGDSREVLRRYASVAHQSGLQLACWGGVKLSKQETHYLMELGINAIYMDEEDIRTVENCRD
jgi:glycerophosphoryl diester phosphodiesterase